MHNEHIENDPYIFIEVLIILPRSKYSSPKPVSQVSKWWERKRSTWPQYSDIITVLLIQSWPLNDIVSHAMNYLVFDLLFFVVVFYSFTWPFTLALHIKYSGNESDLIEASQTLCVMLYEVKYCSLLQRTHLIRRHKRKKNKVKWW